MTGRVAFVLKGYPRLSETFIAQEIRALERRGLEIEIVSLRRPTDVKRHAIHGEITARVLYLPEYLFSEPRRAFRAWRHWRGQAAYPRARAAFLADLRRDPSANRIRRFGQALVLARELGADIARIHAHFLHTPASVARYAALLRGLPWSCSAHAKDIWTTPAWEKREKLASLDWLTTCTEAGRAHLAALAPSPTKVSLVYHGLDLARFPAPEPRSARRGTPAVILSVGRAVPKKGLDDVLDALARIPPDHAWRFVHVGGGPLLAGLKWRAAQLGLGDRVQWLGARDQGELLALYRSADIFVLASRMAPDGDRDGLPNVLMEAQSQGLPCISTRFSGIPELIEDGVTGLLAEPGDVQALGTAIVRLLSDDAFAAGLARAGQARIRARFSLDPGIEVIRALFELEPRPCASPSTRR